METIEVYDIETGEIFGFTINELLREINRDRSEAWQDYNANDFNEGLEHFTEYRLV